jgi:plasmid stabilization system protein ParE
MAVARRNPDAAVGLREAIAEAARLLGARPFAGRAAPDLVGPHYRIWSLSTFPYILVYDPRPARPQILRFAHTARDLGPLMADLAGSPDDTATD